MTPSEFLAPSAGDLIGIDCVYLCDYPFPNRELAAKLDGVLKRGGSVVIGLGPQAAANRADYNRVLFDDGNGILPAPLRKLSAQTARTIPASAWRPTRKLIPTLRSNSFKARSRAAV